MSNRIGSHDRCRARGGRSGRTSRRPCEEPDTQEGDEAEEEEGPGTDPDDESAPGWRRRGISRKGALHRRPLTGEMAPVSRSPITWELRGNYLGLTWRLHEASPEIALRSGCQRSPADLPGTYLPIARDEDTELPTFSQVACCKESRLECSGAS